MPSGGPAAALAQCVCGPCAGSLDQLFGFSCFVFSVHLKASEGKTASETQTFTLIFNRTVMRDMVV